MGLLAYQRFEGQETPLRVQVGLLLIVETLLARLQRISIVVTRTVIMTRRYDSEDDGPARGSVMYGLP